MSHGIKTMKRKHWALIEAMLANPNMTEAEVGEFLCVKHDQAHATLNSPVFVEELNKAFKQKFKNAQRYAVNTMENLAKDGDFQASKFILENSGYKEETNIKVDMGNVEINIVNNDED